MGLGSILGGVIGVATGNPLIGSAIGGGIDALTGKPKKPPTMAGADPSTLPNIDIPGLNFGTGPKVKMPTLPKDIPVLKNNTMLPNNIAVTPMNMPTLPTPKMFGATQGETGALDATTAQGKLYAAMLDPNNPIMKNQRDAQEQLIKNDFLSGLRDTITSNRRQQARGRNGFLNPERMDEQIIGSVNSNATKARLQARDAATNSLKGVASGFGDVAGGHRNNAVLEQGRRTEFLSQLMNYVNQLRTDVGSRVDQLRSDTKDRTQQSREDNTNYYAQIRGDIGTRTNQERQDIISALNLYRNNQATANDNAVANYGLQSDYKARTTENQGVLGKEFIDAISQYLKPGSTFNPLSSFDGIAGSFR